MSYIEISAEYYLLFILDNIGQFSSALALNSQCSEVLPLLQHGFVSNRCVPVERTAELMNQSMKFAS